MMIPGHFSADNFINEKINSSDRRKIRGFNWLIHRKLVIALVLKLVPRSIIQRVRAAAEIGRGGSRNKPPPQYRDQDVAHIRELYATDDAYIRMLFAEKPVVYGNELPGSGATG